MPPKRLLPLVAASLTALCSVGMEAQDEPSDRTFREDISILEVEVQVQVLIDGRPLRGLGRDDFELLVDGKPQELTWFEAIEVDETLSAGRRGSPVTADRPVPDPQVGWRRHQLLLFDFGFSTGAAIQRAVDGAHRMLDSQMLPSDRIGVAIFGEAVGARIVVPFTDDRYGVELGLAFVEALAGPKRKRTVEALERLDAWWRAADGSSALPRPLLADLGRHAGTLIQPLERPIALAGLGIPIAQPGQGGSSYREARLSSILGLGGTQSTVRALGRSMAALVILLRDLPDPKHVIFLSQNVGALATAAEGTSGLFRLKPMIDAFSDTGWVLHAIDIGGLPPPAVSVLDGPEDFDGTVELGLSRTEIAGAANNTLFYLANETGGELFENYNRIHRATEKVLDRTVATYLLAFQPSELAPDGERYDIEVRLVSKIRGARVLHRPSFRAPRPPIERQMTERRMDAADLVLAGREIEELRAQARAIVLPSSEGAAVPVFVELDPGQLDAGPKRKKKVRLDVHGYAIDATGAVRAGFARELKFRPAEEQRLQIADELALDPGRYDLRLLIWDLRGRRRHLATLPLEIPARANGTPMLFGPWFEARAEAVRRFTPSDLDARPGLSQLVVDLELEPIDPDPRISLRRARRFLLLADGLADDEAPRLTLRDETGSAVAGELTLERMESGAHLARFRGLLDGAGLEPGRYRLEASAGGVTTSTDLTIVGPDQSR